jgi:hypothetical protein
MQNPVKERIVKLREEIAQISEANRLYLRSGENKLDAAGDHERRLQRLQEILDELAGTRHCRQIEVAGKIVVILYLSLQQPASLYC